ncbi:MAG: glycosyltransferase family 4 protein [Ardenticatenaceae bacterium]|nr:glycosyltransferase family 4 protein [Ardenticatenaceae bacterium]
MLKTRQRSVGINAHLLSGEAGYRQAGIHQYISQVLRHLPREEGRLRYTVFTQHGRFLQRPDLITVPSRWPTERPLVRIAWEQLVWPWLAQRHGLDLLHSMAFVTPLLALRPTVVTVYDLSFMYYPESFPRGQRLYLRSQTARSVRAARRVITISESGRQDVHRFFGVPLAQIDVVRPGVGEEYRPFPPQTVAQFRQQKGLPERFILHVGTLQPRKNIPILLEALAQLPQRDVCLVLVGGKGWLFAEIFARVEALGLQERVIFTGYVPAEELPLWYNAATVLAFPSRYEGFGMPIVEAMACGTPVVAANVSSMPEAVGEAGLLFAPDSVAQLVGGITAVLQSPALAQELRQKGIPQAQQFSWAESGREMARSYQRALGEAGD